MQGRNGPYLHRWKTNFSNMIFPSETKDANSLVISHTLSNLTHVLVEGTGKENYPQKTEDLFFYKLKKKEYNLGLENIQGC